MRKKWINQIERYQTFDPIPINYPVCSQHFEPSQILRRGKRSTLVKGSVPTIFPIHMLFTYLHIDNYFWFGFFFSRTQLAIEPVYELDKTHHLDENNVVVSEHTDQELSNKAALTSFTTVENEKQTTEAVNKGALTDFPCQSNQRATTSNTIIENETTESVNDDEVFDIPCTSAEAKENEAPEIAENQNQR